MDGSLKTRILYLALDMTMRFSGNFHTKAGNFYFLYLLV